MKRRTSLELAFQQSREERREKVRKRKVRSRERRNRIVKRGLKNLKQGRVVPYQSIVERMEEIQRSKEVWN